MTSAAFDIVREDLEAFADDDQEVVVDTSGQCLCVQGGRELSFSLVSDQRGDLFVEIDEERLPYRDFLAHRLGNLSLLAERIAEKRPAATPYVDTQASLEVPGADRGEGSALELLHRECTTHSPFVSRVLFVTADPGTGKTALLRQYQSEQARRFLDGSSGFVFWHVDLQGRQLLRLSEALLGDLGELRVAGLWMPAIVRLLRYGVLVLAIDGFDELAAEQGGSDALGALAQLVRQMDDQGTIVAASRRTFFDTEDYITRAGHFSRHGGEDCQFDQLSLHEWTRLQATDYLEKVEVERKTFPHPLQTYEEIVEGLGAEDHTMLSRPFLLAQTARALLRFDTSASEFIRRMDDPYHGVQAVIEAFVDREVTEKWKQRDTGEPYLTKDQHLRLLADVAEEMYRAQATTLPVDVVETLATLLLDEWVIDQGRRQQILEMVRMHVLLTPPDGDHRRRSFDHEEFQAWFTAYALKDLLLRLPGEGRRFGIELLSVAQLSDATASYVCALIDRTPERVGAVIDALTALVRREWRPTYLQLNVGTLIPHLLDGLDSPEPIVVDGEALYSSVVFERSHLKDVRIRNGTFLNASFAQVDWCNVHFENCTLGEPIFTRTSSYRDVSLRECDIDGVRIQDDEGGETREYAPERIESVLSGLGIALQTGATATSPRPEIAPDGENRKLVRRVLNLFRRTTIIAQGTVEHRFSRDQRRVLEEILPMMVDAGVVETRKWRGSGNQSAWGLAERLDEIERADGDPDRPLHGFWRQVDELD